ncbi:amidohydrolase family protein [Nordella sp. HKS 07]|uniref:amidohydrolase family protein n=1 Tax=Nordella sp. HKS 07 TaxID=2712222 RepID=UPI00352E5CE3
MPTADIIITNAKILTMDKALPRAEALAIAGNRLLAVGRQDDIAGLKAPHTRVIDARGKTVLPGMIESHMHIFMGSVELDSLMVTGLEGIEALTRAVRAYSAKRPDDKIIVANGANYMTIRPTGIITRQDLDQVLPDRPLHPVLLRPSHRVGQYRGAESGGHPPRQGPPARQRNRHGGGRARRR